MASHVLVDAPSRLAFTLVNLGIGLDRVNGGAGAAISSPAFRCEIHESTEFGLSADAAFAHRDVAVKFAIEFCRRLECRPVHIRITEHIPEHSGFGSKTATLLAIGRGIAVLYRKQIATSEIAKIAGRGRTSGIGANTFDRGGFVVDAGHPVSTAGGSTREMLQPTRYSSRTSVPEVIFAHEFAWPLLIIRPIGESISGSRELDVFARICPVPRPDVSEAAHIACFRMPAAILEGSYNHFCHAVNAVRRSYWKSSQIRMQPRAVQQVADEALANGIDAISISSNGPALYALTKDEDKVRDWLDGLILREVVKDYWYTSVPSAGATVTVR